MVHFTTYVLDGLTVENAAPDDRAVSDSIAWLEPHDSTNVQAGLDLGVRLADAMRRERPEALNYIVLMSDGVANVDATDPFAILEATSAPAGANPLRLITVGVGIENYNDHLLEQLAQHGNGWYRYLFDEEQARSTFRRDTGSRSPHRSPIRHVPRWSGTRMRCGRGALSVTKTALRPPRRSRRTGRSSPRCTRERPLPSSTSWNCMTISARRAGWGRWNCDGLNRTAGAPGAKAATS